jgi:hypothetical protein
MGGQEAWQRGFGAPAGGDCTKHYSADERDEQDKGKPRSPTSSRLSAHH